FQEAPSHSGTCVAIPRSEKDLVRWRQSARIVPEAKRSPGRCRRRRQERHVGPAIAAPTLRAGGARWLFGPCGRGKRGTLDDMLTSGSRRPELLNRLAWRLLLERRALLRFQNSELAANPRRLT